MAVFDGQGKILDFTEIFGRRHRIYALFIPLEDWIGIIKKVVIIQLVKNNTTLKIN